MFNRRSLAANPVIPSGRTRIAPTPSGYLHAGNAFNFLLTERLARATGSALLLRIDDLDAERVRPEYVEDIFVSLEWLGIRIDEGPSGPEDLQRNWSQALRIPRYKSLAQDLRAAGHSYACRCSRAALEVFTASGGHHPCRSIRDQVIGSDMAWRLRIPDVCPVQIRDLKGVGHERDLRSLMQDPVLEQRETGRPAYQLASLADDVDMGVTFLARGEDLLPSTACQIHLATVLGLTSFTAIRTVHHPLMLRADGRKLSKSEGASSLRAMRLSGSGPKDVIAAVEGHWHALSKELSL